MEMAARWTWEEREQIVDVIGCGAIKYNDLKNDHSADYMLSLYDILSNQGDTGVSLQFALACARSVISKSGVPMNELKMAQDVTIELDAGRKNTEGRLLGYCLGSQTKCSLSLPLRPFVGFSKILQGSS
ncbi:arginine--tRNA ligase, chloroplastic/mitochondrial-like isoform X2 [Papaver somniferum]|nr:arginine--tRNA ligase, chloroplastic/mitochondrial-like isoform X2 [Papaver somniferum]